MSGHISGPQVNPVGEWHHDATYVQYKGTDICLDFYCPDCTYHAHYDGYFHYLIECPQCHRIYELTSSIAIRQVEYFGGWIDPQKSNDDPDEIEAWRQEQKSNEETTA